MRFSKTTCVQKGPYLVSGGKGEGSSRDPNTLVGGVVDGIEAFEPGVTVDEVQPRSSGRAKVVEDKVDGRRAATDSGVERPGPGLSILRKLECGLDDERFIWCGLKTNHCCGELTPPMWKNKLNNEA